MSEDTIRPDQVETPTDQADDTPAVEDEHQPAPAEGTAVTQPTKLIRIASMTRAMLDEVRQAPLDEAGRARLMKVHDRSLAELREVLSSDLLAEFDDIFEPLRDDGHMPTEAELRIAQAQLIGWLEGLFHGIQATLWSQQMAAQAQLAEMQRRQLAQSRQRPESSSGLYL